MNDLTAFLNARLDEDEAAAVRLEQDLELMRRGGAWTSSVPPATGNSVTIVSAWTPKRVRDEITLKRAIMKRHVPVIAGYGPLEDQECCVAESSDEDMWYAKSWPCSTILAVAAVYSDHPDYRDGWKP